MVQLVAIAAFNLLYRYREAENYGIVKGGLQVTLSKRI